MTNREQARNDAKEMAIQGHSMEQIADKLEQDGLGGTLDETELQFIVSEARFAKALMPPKPGKIIPRILGIVAIILGVIGWWIGRDGPHVRGYNPGGFGLLAIILGCILLFSPSRSNEKF